MLGGAVLVGKPVPADAGAAFQQFDDEVLVEVAAVFLGFDDPAGAAFVGKSRVFAFAVKLADEEGFARPVLPLLHLLRFRLPFVVVVDGEDVHVFAGGAHQCFVGEFFFVLVEAAAEVEFARRVFAGGAGAFVIGVFESEGAHVQADGDDGV